MLKYILLKNLIKLILLLHVLLCLSASLYSQSNNRAVLLDGELHFLIKGNRRICAKIKKYSSENGKYLDVLSYLDADHISKYDHPWEIKNGEYVVLHNSFRTSLGGALFFDKHKIESVDSLLLYKILKMEFDSLINVHGGLKNMMIYTLNLSNKRTRKNILRPFSEFVRSVLSRRILKKEYFSQVSYDFSLYGESGNHGVFGFMTPFGFEKWEFIMDSTDCMKKTLDISSKKILDLKTADIDNHGIQIDSILPYNPFSIFRDEAGDFIIEHNSGNIYSVDDSIELIGRITVPESDLFLVEDLDKNCLLINGDVRWDNKVPGRISIKRMNEKMLNSLTKFIKKY